MVNSGLLIFREVPESRNSGKSSKSRKIHKTCKIPQDSPVILSNRHLYNIFWNFTCKFNLLAVNLQIYLEALSLKGANNVPNLPGVDYVVKNWALALMFNKGFVCHLTLPLVQFWSILLLKEQMMTSVKKMLKTLVWSAQNRLISREICPKNSHKVCHF